MKERSNIVTFQGNPLVLLGEEPAIGQKAPEFEALENNLSPFSLSSLKGRIRVICSVPSLDTPICDMQTRRFNQEAMALGPEVEILTVSMDLPFAQKRWCAAAGVERVRTLSDHKEASFGLAYGALIKELRLLTRAVFIVDPEGILSYAQWVKEITQEPDYGEVLSKIRTLI